MSNVKFSGFCKILVTGASGFVGSFLLDKLLDEGKLEIIALHNRPLTKETLNRYGSKVCWVELDITSDDLSSVVSGVDAVFHLAAYSSIGNSSADCQKLEKVNVEGTKRLALISKKSNVRHFIFVSSVAACEAGKEVEITEFNGFHITPYGKSKKDAEDFLLSISGSGFEVTVLRPSALFGENHTGSIYELAKKIQQRRFVLFGDGLNPTNFYYIRDFVNMLVAVLGNPKTFGEVFIAADKAYPLKDFINWVVSNMLEERQVYRIPLWVGRSVGLLFDVVSRLTGKNLPFSTRRFRAMTRYTVYVNDKLINTIGNQHTMGVRNGLKRTIAWFRQTGML